jgi:membrane-bound lytic murein transglycosylase B
MSSVPLRRTLGCATIFLSFLFVCIPFFSAHSVSAQETGQERRARLEAELVRIEADIAANRGNLERKQSERQSLERDLGVIDSQITQAKLSLKQRTLTIDKLEGQIQDKMVGIRSLDAQHRRGMASLREIVRRIDEIDNISVLEYTLNGNLTDTLDALDEYASVQGALLSSFDTIQVTQKALKTKAEELEVVQSEEEDMRILQAAQKRAMEEREKEKQVLIKQTKGDEKAYKNIIAEKERSAKDIRSSLFNLRDSSSISFGSAYQYAKDASVPTGVRPAFILAILAVESNVGKNIGTGSWKVDMHPTRDRPVFSEICAELGIDPDKQPVSKKPWYGWGGAMGPGQFIPSTWKGLAKRITKITGQSPANPFDARTAIFATALYSADNGAGAGTKAAERLAALRYLAGWGNANKPAYAFYGDDVMRFAEKFQKEIEILER